MIFLMAEDEYVDLKLALKDYLRDNGLTLNDILMAMDEDKEGVMEALAKRTLLTEDELELLERRLTSRQLNTLLFVIQVFYMVNLSGLYKGRLIYPCRDDIVRNNRVTSQGVRMVLKALGIRMDWG